MLGAFIWMDALSIMDHHAMWTAAARLADFRTDWVLEQTCSITSLAKWVFLTFNQTLCVDEKWSSGGEWDTDVTVCILLYIIVKHHQCHCIVKTSILTSVTMWLADSHQRQAEPSGGMLSYANDAWLTYIYIAAAVFVAASWKLSLGEITRCKLMCIAKCVMRHNAVHSTH